MAGPDSLSQQLKTTQYAPPSYPVTPAPAFFLENWALRVRDMRPVVTMASVADKYDITAIADVIADRILAALDAGGSYSLEDARRTNFGEGWTYEEPRRNPANVERIEGMRLSEEQLDRAWLTANRRVDNEAGLVWPDSGDSR